MDKTTETYDLLACLLGYPDKDYKQNLEECRRHLSSYDNGIADILAQFETRVEKYTTEQLEEIFTGTFDLNPDCSLEVGWHLFGEEYDRGSFLVKMRSFLREFGLAESSELPDHLSHVLRILGRLETEKADRFALACVIPALKKMLEGLKEKHNLYHDLVLTISRFVENRHRDISQEVHCD